MIAPIDELERSLAKLPGFGRRSAARAALALVREPGRLLEPLVSALETARHQVCCCTLCGSFTTIEANPCRLCSDPLRDHGIICVVEDAADIVSIESSGAFKGVYHSLGGKLSAMHHVGPEQLRLAQLRDRVRQGDVREILLALSTDMEGDATAGYINEFLRDTEVKITQLAFGLPVNSGVAYSDPLTLKRAIVNRIGS